MAHQKSMLILDFDNNGLQLTAYTETACLLPRKKCIRTSTSVPFIPSYRRTEVAR